MITKKEYNAACRRARKFFKKAGIILTPEEKKRIEIADFGLGDLAHVGLIILTYINTKRCCAKELVLFPGQTCPEHCHPSAVGEQGKEETFRCRWGKVYLYMSGRKTSKTRAKPPRDREKYYTVWHEIVLNPGEQYTLKPDMLHWFQAGRCGAVVSEFSTTSRDECDIFSDPEIERSTKVV
ncbi:MAG: D-lyxose/D-mannose family sugar isomerase [Candidatus Omnitrophica bacterium]|nr:D-lyxose/D-mannose family sugar isomerase [Candidatus Omnitrophota bacterium]MCK4422527.1 D-lyxose/D-mannose family sugar isomerase [Candidatus Omnitrophota bacterium]